MVRTGARSRELATLLSRVGLRTVDHRPRPPRIEHLSVEDRVRVDAIYRALGGSATDPSFRPGPWDLVLADGRVVELDEELHFNRYREMTLEAQWAYTLPWSAGYLGFCRQFESSCLSSGGWGKRWTNPPSENLFGAADAPGSFSCVGAPRWKQRALYDTIKDLAALGDEKLSLVRVATVDTVEGVRLGEALDLRATVDLDALSDLVLTRTT